MTFEPEGFETAAGHTVRVHQGDEGTPVTTVEDGREVWREPTVTEVERLEPGGGGVLVHGAEGLRAMR